MKSLSSSWNGTIFLGNFLWIFSLILTAMIKYLNGIIMLNSVQFVNITQSTIHTNMKCINKLPHYNMNEYFKHILLWADGIKIETKYGMWER